MSSRVFFVMLETPGQEGPDPRLGAVFEALGRPCSLGRLEGDPAGNPGPREPWAWLQDASCAVCSVNMPCPAAQRTRLRGLSLECAAADLALFPAERAGLLRPMLERADRALQNRAAASPLRTLELAELLARNEPWDLFLLRLSGTGAGDPSPELLERLAGLACGFTAEVKVLGICRGGKAAQWFALDAGPEARALPDACASDLWATALQTLGLQLPAEQRGASLLLWQDRTAGYTREDEQKIQERLEDLGYL